MGLNTMSNGKYKFIIGFFVGIVLAALFFMYFAPRYQTVETGGVLYKHDRWSGDIWRYNDNEWKKVSQHDKDWKRIDEVLIQALKISGVDKVRAAALQQLKDKYPILREFKDEEILERVKMVYAREILSNLYLDNFMKIQQNAPADTSRTPQ